MKQRGATLTRAALLATVVACATERERDHARSAATDPRREAPLTAHRAGDTLLLANADSEPIYFAVYPSDVLPHIEWAPCDTPVSCMHVSPGATLRLAIAHEPLTVFWWRLRTVPNRADRWAPDRVTPIGLPLPPD